MIVVGPSVTEIVVEREVPSVARVVDVDTEDEVVVGLVDVEDVVD